MQQMILFRAGDGPLPDVLQGLDGRVRDFRIMAGNGRNIWSRAVICELDDSSSGLADALSNDDGGQGLALLAAEQASFSRDTGVDDTDVAQFLVLSNPADAIEEVFSSMYKDRDMVQAMQIPGALSVTRYALTPIAGSCGWAFLTLCRYQDADEAVIDDLADCFGLADLKHAAPPAAVVMQIAENS